MSSLINNKHTYCIIIEIVVVGGNVIQSFVSAGEVHPDLHEVSRHFLASQQQTAEKIVRLIHGKLLWILINEDLDKR